MKYKGRYRYRRFFLGESILLSEAGESVSGVVISKGRILLEGGDILQIKTNLAKIKLEEPRFLLLRWWDYRLLKRLLNSDEKISI